MIDQVKEDGEYLEGFIKIYGGGVRRCREKEDIGFLDEEIGFVVDSEREGEENVWGVGGV